MIGYSRNLLTVKKPKGKPCKERQIKLETGKDGCNFFLSFKITERNKESFSTKLNQRLASCVEHFRKVLVEEERCFFGNQYSHNFINISKYFPCI